MTETDRNLRRRMLDAFKVRFHDETQARKGYDDNLFAALEQAIAVRDAALAPNIVALIDQAIREADEVSDMITAGKRIPRDMTESLRNHVRKLAAALQVSGNTATAPPILIDMCDHGHKFAKLDDHPTRDGKARCPHCMAIGLDKARADIELVEKALMWANRCNDVQVCINEYKEAKGE